MREYLYRRLHTSWLIAGASVGFIVGVALSAVLSFHLEAGQVLALVTVLSTIAFTKRSRTMIVLVFIAGLVLGVARGGSLQQALDTYRPYYGESITLQGNVSEDVTISSNGSLRMQLSAVRINNRSLPGKVWVDTKTLNDIKRSDIVWVEGILSEGFGNFPASMFRAQVVSTERVLHGDVAREVRDWFAAGVREAVPEPEASLGVGYLVGQRSTLPEELDNQLKLLGLTHIVVASGYNLTILVRFTRRGLARHSKYLATMAASFMICGFVLVTGFSPSMSRAALVTGISLFAWYFGRRVHPLLILPFAAAVTAAINPAFVWGDIGWYLSFTAFAGVMILAPLLKRLLYGEKQPRSISQILLETFAAQLATLPIIAFVFGQYSSLALPANAFVLPLVPLAMFFTFLAGIAGVVFPSVASLFGMPATIVLRYMTEVVDHLAAIPGASSELVVSVWSLIAGYLILIGVCVLLWCKTKYNFRDESIID